MAQGEVRDKGRAGEPDESNKEKADRAAKKASPVVQAVARVGYVAKGVVYATVGVLAFRVATGNGGETTGTSGAVNSIGSQPFGGVMLMVLALGLVAYALWKLVQGVMDPERKGKDFGGIIRRVAYGGSALIHASLAFTALEELFGREDQSGTFDQWTAQAMGQPFGRWLVMLAGLGVVGVGLYQLYAGLKGEFRDHLRMEDMGGARETLTLWAGRVGTSARAVVIIVAGSFVLLAAYQADPEEARGIGGALNTLVQQPFGPYLLGVVAAGLVAYGLFMLLIARYRNVNPT